MPSNPTSYQETAWAGMVVALAIAWVLEPDMRGIGTTALFVATIWAVLSRLQGGKWFIPGVMLAGCGMPWVFGDDVESLHSLGWTFYTIALMLLACTLSARLRRMLLATDSMRAAFAGFCARRGPSRYSETRRND